MSDAIKSPPTLDDLRAHRDEILALAERYGAYNVRVFGSVVHQKANATSDVDFLVDLPPRYSLLKLSGLIRSLQELLGYKVDVASAAHLREELRSTILKDAEPL